MKPRKPPLEYHSNHITEIRTTPSHNGAYYHCIGCNKWIAWLSKQEADAARKLKLI